MAAEAAELRVAMRSAGAADDAAADGAVAGAGIAGAM